MPTDVNKKRSFFDTFDNFDAKEIGLVRRFIKRVLFVLLLIADFFIILQCVGRFLGNGRVLPFAGGLVSVAVLGVVDAIKLFYLKRLPGKMVCHAVEAVAVFCLAVFVGPEHMLVLYMLVLTELYVSTTKMFPSVIVCGGGIFLYVLSFWISTAIRENSLPVTSGLSQSYGDSVILFLHFAMITVSFRFYRQYIRLKKAMKELDKSNAELQKAYDELEEKTALEERQRIAKDIHDTAGHSITTVIMQTEAAKLIIDRDPEEAKTKIVAANLQAKHALEELRDSVHLLSGRKAGETLKSGLEAIIGESTDGTGIVIRSEIEDVTVSEAKYRFLCNTLKEGISNGLRHGNATAFWIELKKDGKKLSFLLSDNGDGADLLPKKGFGLSEMERVAKRLGGTVELYTEKGEGFEIRIELPADKTEE